MIINNANAINRRDICMLVRCRLPSIIARSFKRNFREKKNMFSRKLVFDWLLGRELRGYFRGKNTNIIISIRGILLTLLSDLDRIGQCSLDRKKKEIE